MFDQNQIQEFKEAFNMIDQNSDGFVDKEDLHDMLASLGKDPKDDYLEEMIKMSPGPINFTMFLTLFGEKLNGTDPEDVIVNAFACFDEDGNGKVHEDILKEALTSMGDRFTEDQVDDVLRDAPIDKDGYLDYNQFTHILKHGKKDDNDWLTLTKKKVLSEPLFACNLCWGMAAFVMWVFMFVFFDEI